jgi:hypothetical protein
MAAKYRKFLPQTYRQDWFRELAPPKPNPRYLYIYLLTAPHTTSVSGLSAARPAGLADELRWPVKAFLAMFDQLERAGQVKADWEAGVVWVPGAVEYNDPESGNVVKSWATNAVEIPKCNTPTLLRSLPGNHHASFNKAFREGFAYSGAEAGIPTRPGAGAVPGEEHYY